MASTKTSIQEKENEIIEEFALFDDWMDKYQFIIDMGKKLPDLPEIAKSESNRVHGCQSKVWLTSSISEDGKVQYEADSDAFITRGLIALLIRVLSNQYPLDIIDAKLEFIDEIGMRQNLSANRSNGLTAMIQKMKDYASEGLKAKADAANDKEKSSEEVTSSKIEATEGSISDESSGEGVTNRITEDQVVEVLKTIYDPEIPVNIYDLGLIYKITLPGKDGVRILMTLTAPNCPVAGTFPATVRDRVMYDLETDEVEVNLTFEPPYEMDMMSEAAKLELGFA